MRLLAGVIMGLCLSFQVLAQSNKLITELPDISVIGNFQAVHSESGTSFDVKEIEFAFQHYLYPSIKADIFAALHKEEDGKRNFELEEAYVTFSDLWSVVFLENNSQIGLGAVVGKKLLGIGKVNPLHPEQYHFIDRPLATQQFLGGEEGLAAEGGALQYILPFPFFSQIEWGYWTAAPHEEEGGHAHESLPFTNTLMSTRLWNSFELSDTQELQFGLSHVLGNASASSSEQKQSVFAVDLTHTVQFMGGKSVMFQAEFYHGYYGDDGEPRANQKGGFFSTYYTPSKYYQLGLRYGWLGKHGDEGQDDNRWTVLASRQLTETSKFRLQYTSALRSENTVTAQFIFGMGPHSHVLQ